MGKTMMAMALAMFVVAAVDVRTQSRLDDGQILALFDEANTVDIWTARLAMSRSQSADVRRLASMVIADHEAVQHSARELAKKLHITPTPPADDTSAEALGTTREVVARLLARLARLRLLTRRRGSVVIHDPKRLDAWSRALDVRPGGSG